MSPCIYVSFDIRHDRPLYERLVDESTNAGFTVSSGSEVPFGAEIWDARLRRRIREADQMIVICGEHSDASKCMSDEIRIAREEGTPFFLLWGRRETMCTKPIGAKGDEGMYNWTPTNLQNQIAIALRSRTRVLETRSLLSSTRIAQRADPRATSTSKSLESLELAPLDTHISEPRKHETG